jgi:hypothetical protein
MWMVSFRFLCHSLDFVSTVIILSMLTLCHLLMAYSDTAAFGDFSDQILVFIMSCLEMSTSFTYVPVSVAAAKPLDDVAYVDDEVF